MRKAMGILICVLCVSSAYGSGNRILIFGNTLREAHVAIIPLVGESLRHAFENRGYPSQFSQESSSLLSASRYDTVVLLDVSEGIIEKKTQEALERYVIEGGSLVAVHASIAAGKDWAGFQSAVGTLFLDHPIIQSARVTSIADNKFTKNIPMIWSQSDEWYNFTKAVPADVDVLATVDERSYSGGKMGNTHAVSWLMLLDW